MQINIPNEIIEQMVKEQVNESVRTRIKEMQGNYTSKGFIENLIRDVIWDKINKLCPDIENYIKEEVKRCITSAFEYQKSMKFSKKELAEQIIDNLIERFNL